MNYCSLIVKVAWIVVSGDLFGSQIVRFRRMEYMSPVSPIFLDQTCLTDPVKSLYSWELSYQQI